MRTFDLKRGADTLTLTDTGKVNKGAAEVGTWGTNNKSQIVITEAGAASPVDVDWQFDANNHLCVAQAGKKVFDINGDLASTPAFRVDRAVMFIKPIETGTFEFAIRPTWNLNKTHDLVMTVNGKESAIDGVISDRNSAFRFRFVDKLEPIETFALLFKGSWHNSPDPAQPAAVVYEYDIDGAANGVFTLPNQLVVDNNSLVLAYNYDKAGRTHSTQLVGNFNFDSFELSFAIERKSAAEGSSTTLRFAVDVKGKSADGKIVFSLKRSDTGGVTTTELAIGGKFTARFKAGVLTVGVQFSQRTINGAVAARELTFAGKLVQTSGTTFAWQLRAGNGSTEISISASEVRLGTVGLSADLNVVMADGSTQSVRGMFGVSF
jgi:hypothetical protein